MWYIQMHQTTIVHGSMWYLRMHKTTIVHGSIWYLRMHNGHHLQLFLLLTNRPVSRPMVELEVANVSKI